MDTDFLNMDVVVVDGEEEKQMRGLGKVVDTRRPCNGKSRAESANGVPTIGRPIKSRTTSAN